MLVKVRKIEVSIRRRLRRPNPLSLPSTSSPGVGYMLACFPLALSLYGSTPPYSQIDGMRVGDEDPWRNWVWMMEWRALEWWRWWKMVMGSDGEDGRNDSKVVEARATP